MRLQAFLDLPRHKDISSMGKRIFPHAPMSFRERRASLQPQIAAALGVSINEVFGVDAKRRLIKQGGDSRLLAIEKLDLAVKRKARQLLDAFMERGQLKRNVESRN